MYIYYRYNIFSPADVLQALCQTGCETQENWASKIETALALAESLSQTLCVDVESRQKVRQMSLLEAGSAVAQSVEDVTPGEGVQGSIPAVAARSLLVGSVSV